MVRAYACRLRPDLSVRRGRRGTTSVSLGLDQDVPIRIRRNARAKRLILRADPSTGEAIVTCPPWVSELEAEAFATKQSDWIRMRLASSPKPVSFASGVIIPFLGIDHVIRHHPHARGGVWHESECKQISRIDSGTAQDTNKLTQISESDLRLDDTCNNNDLPMPSINVTGRAEHLSRRLTDWLKREARRQITPRVAEAASKLDVTPGRITVRDTKSRWGSCAANGNLSFSWRLVLAPEEVLDYVVAHEVAHLIEHNHGPRFWALVDGQIDGVAKRRAWLRKEGAALHLIGV